MMFLNIRISKLIYFQTEESVSLWVYVVEILILRIVPMTQKPMNFYRGDNGDCMENLL